MVNPCSLSSEEGQNRQEDNGSHSNVIKRTIVIIAQK